MDTDLIQELAPILSMCRKLVIMILMNIFKMIIHVG